MSVKTQGFPEIVQVTTPTATNGTITLGSAAAGCMGVGQLIDGAVYDYSIFDVNGTDSEAGHGTYTASGTTLSRDKAYRSIISGTEGTTKLTLSASGSTVIIGLSGDREARRWKADQTYISGLLVTKHTAANSLDISAGSCFDPSSGRIITYAGGSAVSAGSLGNSQWNQVYLWDSAGTPTIEVVNNADAPSTTYAGNARQGGTHSGRWIGAFLTDGSANVYDSLVNESALGQIEVFYLATVNAAPFRILSGGTATSYGSETSAVSAVPRYAALAALMDIVLGATTTGGDGNIALSLDGSNAIINLDSYVAVANSSYVQQVIWMPLERSVPGLYYQLNVIAPLVGPIVYMDVPGYRAVR